MFRTYIEDVSNLITEKDNLDFKLKIESIKERSENINSRDDIMLIKLNIERLESYLASHYFLKKGLAKNVIDHILLDTLILNAKNQNVDLSKSDTKTWRLVIDRLRSNELKSRP